MTSAASEPPAGAFTVHLVRHGRASATWDRAADPGLDELGRAQAVAVADELAASLGVRRLVTSPAARAHETAMPLAARWRASVEIDAAFGEVPAPTSDLAERGEWLRAALVSTWDDLGAGVARWRRALVAAATHLGDDAVVFTHFVAINALVGWAEGSALVTTFAPANASVTVVRVEPDALGAPRLTVVRRGAEAPPQVG